MNELLLTTAEALKRRGFESEVFATAKEAADYVRRNLPANADIAFGGSMTSKQLGLETLLREDGHTVLWHWEVAPAERYELLHKAMQCPYYICSANALTEDGLIVQIDGTGNRVAALCYGPDTVYMLVGRNKIVKGGYQQAVARCKQYACPQNARRYNLDTPCAKTDKCNAAECKSSLCHAFLALELKPIGIKTMKVLLIDEDLGY